MVDRTREEKVTLWPYLSAMFRVKLVDGKCQVSVFVVCSGIPGCVSVQVVAFKSTQAHRSKLVDRLMLTSGVLCPN